MRIDYLFQVVKKYRAQHIKHRRARDRRGGTGTLSERYTVAPLRSQIGHKSFVKRQKKQRILERLQLTSATTDALTALSHMNHKTNKVKKSKKVKSTTAPMSVDDDDEDNDDSGADDADVEFDVAESDTGKKSTTIQR